MRVLFFTLAALSACVSTPSGGVELTFPSIEDGRAIVAARDGFFESMNDVDVRLRTADGRSSDSETLRTQFVEGVETWDDAERARLQASMTRLAPRLSRFARLLPRSIPVVKVSRTVEDGLPHTRGDAILFPGDALAAIDDATLDFALAHEIFHVLSRRHARHHDELYAVIGFHRCTVELPAELAGRRISNPDAAVMEHYVALGRTADAPAAVPIVLLRPDAPNAPPPLLNDSMMARLMLVEVRAGRCRVLPGPDGHPVLRRAAEAPAVFDVIGRNSTYAAHPEELLADNFAVLLTNPEQAQSPDVLERLGRALDGL